MFFSLPSNSLNRGGVAIIIEDFEHQLPKDKQPTLEHFFKLKLLVLRLTLLHLSHLTAKGVPDVSV